MSLGVKIRPFLLTLHVGLTTVALPVIQQIALHSEGSLQESVI